VTVYFSWRESLAGTVIEFVLEKICDSFSSLANCVFTDFLQCIVRCLNDSEQSISSFCLRSVCHR
jgi:hypothetical protein